MNQHRGNLEQRQSIEAAAPYEAPRFLVHDLAVITLGGSPGAADSGTGTGNSAQAPFNGNTTSVDDDENLYDDDPLSRPWDR